MTDSANNFHEIPKYPISTCEQSAGYNFEDKREKKRNLDCKEDTGESNTDRQPEVSKEEFACDNSEEKKAKGQNESNELERRFSRWAKRIQACIRNIPLETQLVDTERVKNGIDLIPAFRSHG